MFHRFTPTRTLLGSTAVVGVSTIALPWIHGYGTGLFQIVVLGAFAIVAAVSSNAYADLHHGPVWCVALSINVLLFIIPAALIFFATNGRWPRASTTGILTWCIFYLACLFILFPATDGP
jgi:hypothetical protein